MWTQEAYDLYSYFLKKYPAFAPDIKSDLKEALDNGTRKTDYGIGGVCLKLGGSEILKPARTLKNRKTKSDPRKKYKAWAPVLSIICLRIESDPHQVLGVYKVLEKSDSTLNGEIAKIIDKGVHNKSGYHHGKPCNGDDDEEKDEGFRNQYINRAAISPLGANLLSQQHWPILTQ